MNLSSMPRRLSLVAVLLPLSIAHSTASFAQQEAAWSGNMAKDPGFEEDFVNLKAEAHYLSFKGDWFYNQKDDVPDYWKFAGPADWKWTEREPHSGRHALQLGNGVSVTQSYFGAIYHEGGGSWEPAEAKPITLTRPERFRKPWRASVWCRGGGALKLGETSKPAEAGSGWQLLTVEVPAASVPKDLTMTVTLTGPGEFDDLVVQEQLDPSPNLIPNPGFERIDGRSYPTGWSQQRKFAWIGPTYYVWTDWMHSQRENRGQVTTDRLIHHSGDRSLRFDVYPGDEKFIESDAIRLNQDQPHCVEVAAYVRADRIKMIDIRCVDEEGANLPSVHPIQPEWGTGGTALFGNGTFEWRYVRKFFAMPFNKPSRGFRVRLAARGFNASTLDDSGTRSYACQSGTVWWDDLRVLERGSTPQELKSRGVVVPPSEVDAATAIGVASLDLGERMYGSNRARFEFVNSGPAAVYCLNVDCSLPGRKPVTTASRSVAAGAGGRVVLETPYAVSRLAGDLMQQGKLRLRLQRGSAIVADSTYSFNTWPAIVDTDISRHYNLPTENPVTASFNLGVAADTLTQTKRLEIKLIRQPDGAVLGSQIITDLPTALAKTRSALPTDQKDSWEFNMPTPAYWADHTNLIVTKLDLSRLKVWPHNNPTRDTVVTVQGFDAGGRLLFSDQSDGLCRVQAPPRQPAIESVQVRRDGAVLINNQPRFLTGATHGNQRTQHNYALIGQLGLMGHRMPQGDTFENIRKAWEDNNIYALQFKPVARHDGTVVYLDLKPEEKQALTEFTKSGGMKSVVSINTGGWESQIPDTEEARTKHQALNDWIRKLTNRPLAWSSGNHHNAWNMSGVPFYDIVHAETEMWGPMEFNVIFMPYMKKLRKDPTTWVYLPQLYDNTPYERYRFETYENIIRGSAGVSMIQGIGDPSFNRGLAGELRYLEAPLYSQEKAPAVALQPPISHMVRRYKGKTYIVATNAGPIILGDWKWNRANKKTGTASHEGDSVNRMWRRPDGMRLHGFRGSSRPELVKPGDKIVQYVWLDPKEKPDWTMLAVRGDGRFSHAAVLGRFDFNTFRENYGNIFMYSELEHTVWGEINWILDPPTYQRAIKLMGKAWADNLKKSADSGRALVDKKIYKAEHFHNIGALPAPGQWYRIEVDAAKLGLVGKLVDGFAYMSRNGRALWDYSALERSGKVVRVFCDDTTGIDRALLGKVAIRVAGIKDGTKVRALFENRTLTVKNGSFTDNFVGVDTYGYEAGCVVGDMFGYVKDDNRDLPRMMPSGYGYSYGPTAVHIYEIEP